MEPTEGACTGRLCQTRGAMREKTGGPPPKTQEPWEQLHGPSRPLAHSRVSKAEPWDSGDWRIESDQATPQFREENESTLPLHPFSAV